MVVVDTGSKDQTPQIAARLGARVFHFPWPDSFSVARNKSLDFARGEWIFWMDSDDTIDAQNGRRLRALADCQHPPDVVGYVMQVHCPEPEQDGQTDVTVVDHVKLFRNRPEFRFEFRIHEQIIPALRRAGGEIVRTDIHVVHSGADHSPAGQQRKLKRDLRLLKLDLRERPDHPFVLFNLGMTYNYAGKHHKAVKMLQRCLAVSSPADSHVRKAYAYLVGSLAGLEQHDAAWDACQRGCELFPRDPELQFRRGLLAQHFGRLHLAEQAYLAALADNDAPHFSSISQGIVGYKANFNLADVYAELGRWPEAEAQWRRVVADMPNSREGWHGLGHVLLRQAKYDQLERLVEDLTGNDRLRAEGLCLASRLACARGDVPAAKSHLTKAVEAYPDDLHCLEGLCRLLFEAGQPAEARSALLKLLERQPEDAATHYNLGAVYLRLAETEQAIASLRRSVRLRPQSARTWLFLGDALARCGDLREAVSAWREAADRDTEGRIGGEARQRMDQAQQEQGAELAVHE
jgi:tetratricopeptide (TPR) repeat protein